MPIKYGSTGVGAVYYGSTAIGRIYHGSTLVFDGAGGSVGGPTALVGYKIYKTDGTAAINVTTTGLSGGTTGDTEAKAGDLVVLVWAWAGDADYSGASLSSDPGFTLRSDLLGSDTYRSRQRVWTLTAASNAPSVTVGSVYGITHGVAVAVVVLRNAEYASHTTATRSNTYRPIPPSITPTTSGSWIFYFVNNAHTRNGGLSYTGQTDLTMLINETSASSAGSDTNADTTIGVGYNTDGTTDPFSQGEWTMGAANSSAYSSTSSAFEFSNIPA